MTTDPFERRLAALHDRLPPGALRHGGKGLEKESLRVTPLGRIVQTPHPRALGSALTHPYITTDYSEALLEFVTPPFEDSTDTLAFLDDIHAFVYRRLGEERLWASSMPCALEEDSRIPIAEYGTSNVGRMKHIYRRGLGHRYGRRMQTISGVHFNYSYPESLWPWLKEAEQDGRTLREFKDEWYFRALRNFQRLGWLVPYLFGSSPALCKTFLHGQAGGFAEFDAHTLFEPHATSLRLSDIGYKNKNQAHIGVTYDSVDGYVDALTHAITTPEPEYARIGIKANGEYRQLNANILQIENEFYGFIRPKQPIETGERATLALKRRGVLYLEVRALDVNPFHPNGVDAQALRFIEALLLLCLLLESPPIGPEEQSIVARNQSEVARRGRDPLLQLVRNGQPVLLRAWADEILERLSGLCEILDRGDAARPYSHALAVQREAVMDAHRTPSARVLDDMRRHHESFFAFARRQSDLHREHYLAFPLAPATEARFETLARETLDEQAAIEQTDTLPFDEYLRQYFAQT